jgi:hypothetical protein
MSIAEDRAIGRDVEQRACPRSVAIVPASFLHSLGEVHERRLYSLWVSGSENEGLLQSYDDAEECATRGSLRRVPTEL